MKKIIIAILSTWVVLLEIESYTKSKHIEDYKRMCWQLVEQNKQAIEIIKQRPSCN